MLTRDDTPTAQDVLALHQWALGAAECRCGMPVPEETYADTAEAWMATHQLGMLQAADLAVVSVHGTAAVVKAAAAVVGAMKASGWGESVWRPDLLALRDAVENMTR